MTRPQVTVLLFLCCFLGLPALSVRADDVVGTLPYWNGTGFVGEFGEGSYSVLGQSITVPTDGNTTLHSFTLAFYEVATNYPVTYDSEVYAWNGTQAVGPQLYQSSPKTLSSAGGTEYDTFTPNISLASGGSYVIFATTDFETHVDAGASLGVLNYTTVYTGGSEVYLNDSGLPSEWTTKPWTSFPGQDLAFQADFAASVPEPALLPIAAVAAIGMLRRRVA
jgi:hypothetical protein